MECVSGHGTSGTSREITGAGAYHKGLKGDGGGQEVGRVGFHCRRQERVKGDGGQSRTDIAETPSTKVWNLS